MADRTLRNDDVADRELLHLINDVSDSNGMTKAEDVAARLGIDPNGRRVSPTVSSRLSQMAWRYRFLERIEPQQLGLPRTAGPRYVITPKGRAVMGGRLTTGMLRELDREDPGTEVLLMREVARRAYRSGDPSAVRREFQHQSARGRR